MVRNERRVGSLVITGFTVLASCSNPTRREKRALYICCHGTPLDPASLEGRLRWEPAKQMLVKT